MKILSAQQIRDWDEYSILYEPIASIDLMERAASKCFNWLQDQGFLALPFAVFCGRGNNGGDGLAIARMLTERNCKADVYILEIGNIGTADFQENLARIRNYPETAVYFIQDENSFPFLPVNTMVIDAMFGSGLTRPLDGLNKKMVEHINKSGCEIISIDIPSGLAVDQSSKGNTTVKATYTLSFQCYKKALLLAENADSIGETHILDIGLHPGFLQTIETNEELIHFKFIQSMFKPRNRFSHKGNFGHALLLAGSYGKIGAAVLSAKACLRSGVGLLSCHVPKCGYNILQTTIPEAMLMTDIHSSFITKTETDLADFDAIGIGPGLGTAAATRKLLKEILKKYKKPVLLDADALNSLAMEKKLPSLPPGSILTPHPKEFERLFGKTKNDFDRIEKILFHAKMLNCNIVLKGHFTFIGTSDGRGFFNSTGNAGMATAGSGDVLSGVITGLLAQGYAPEQAAILGVYLHGLAGDFAAKKYSEEAMLAGNITDHLGEAFKQLQKNI